VSLNRNQISTVEDIAHLTVLTALYRQVPFIADIAGSEKLASLGCLCLSWTHITKVIHPSALTHLLIIAVLERKPLMMDAVRQRWRSGTGVRRSISKPRGR
jgi:hypothetical protein